VQFGNRGRALDMNVQFRSFGSIELIAHDVAARTNVEEDVVGGTIAVPFLEGVDDPLTRNVLREQDCITDVRTNVVAGGFEA